MEKEKNKMRKNGEVVLLAIGAVVASAYMCSEINNAVLTHENELDQLCGKNRSNCISYENVECSGFFTGLPTCHSVERFATPTPMGKRK